MVSGMAEKTTPMPNVEAKMTAETASITDLARSVSGLLRKPASREPTTAMAPTEKSSVALTKPSAKPPSPRAKRACAHSPRRSRPRSMRKSSPMNVPTTAEMMTMSTLAVSMAPETPMTSTHSAST